MFEVNMHKVITLSSQPEKSIEKLKATLPSIEELEKELSKDIETMESAENE